MLTDPKLLSEMYKLVFVESKPKAEAISALRLQGWSITDRDYSSFRKNAMTAFADNGEHIRESMLESFDAIKDDFDMLVQKTKDVMRRAELKGDDRMMLNAIGELRSSLTVAMRRLGELTDKVTNVQNVSISGDINLIDKMQVVQSEMFDKYGAKEKDGVIVFEKTSPELLLDLRSHKSKITQ